MELLPWRILNTDLQPWIELSPTRKAANLICFLFLKFSEEFTSFNKFTGIDISWGEVSEKKVTHNLIELQRFSFMELLSCWT